jgi:hypothetical protein
MKRAIFYSIFGLFLLVIVLPIVGSFSKASAVLLWLPSGWWFFLKRNLAHVSVNWTLLASGVLCSAIVVIVGHRLLSALWLRWQQIRQLGASARQWRWKWTLGFYAAIWLLFAIAFGAAGVFRHTAWVMREKGPWYHERRHESSEMLTQTGVMAQMALDSGETVESLQKALLSDHYTRNSPMLEDFSVLLFADQKGMVKEYLIIPRNPQVRGRGVFCLADTKGASDLRPMSELNATIKDLETRYPTKSESTGP